MSSVDLVLNLINEMNSALIPMDKVYVIRTFVKSSDTHSVLIGSTRFDDIAKGIKGNDNDTVILDFQMPYRLSEILDILRGNDVPALLKFANWLLRLCNCLDIGIKHGDDELIDYIGQCKFAGEDAELRSVCWEHVSLLPQTLFLNDIGLSTS